METTEKLNNESAYEFLMEEDAPEMLLNNLPSFNERTEDIIALTSDMVKYGSNALKQYLPHFQRAIDFSKKNQRFPNLIELNTGIAEPIPERTEPFTEAAYAEIANILNEEKKVAEYRSVLRSKDVGRLVEFAKTLQPSTPLPELDFDNILDVQSLRKRARSNNKIITTGIEIFDETIYGFRNKTVNTISAPTAGGKTTFAVNMSYNNAIKGKLVVYCALESSADEILSSLISTACKHRQKEDSTFLAKEISEYKNFPTIYKSKPGTVNSLRFYSLSQATDDLLVKNYKEHITQNGGNIYVIDDNLCNLRSISSLTSTIEAIAQKEGRKVDFIVIDNADELISFEYEGKSESDMNSVNKMINQLNAYSTTHYNGEGTVFVMLAQLNREGIRELEKNTPMLNCTHISTYSNLYTKASVVASFSLSKKFQNLIELRVIKNRNGRNTSNEETVYIPVEFEYSYIDGAGGSVRTIADSNSVSDSDDNDDLSAGIYTGEDDEDIGDITLEDGKWDWDT